MVEVVRNVVDCMSTGEEPVLSYRKALRPSEIIFAFYESIRQNRRIELPLAGAAENAMVNLLAERAQRGSGPRGEA